LFDNKIIRLVRVFAPYEVNQLRDLLFLSFGMSTSNWVKGTMFGSAKPLLFGAAPEANPD
jgi:hypothetical protein